MKRRVAITGVGLCSPIGNSLKAMNESIRAGRHGIRYQHDWDDIENPKSLATRLAATVEVEFKPYSRRKTRSMGRVSLLASHATDMAIEDAGLSEDARHSGRVGLAYGSTNGSSEAMVEHYRLLNKSGFARISGTSFLKFMSHTCAANLAQHFEIRGRVLSTSAACVSASQAIGTGFELIRSGIQDMMIVGGAEEMHYVHAGVFDVLYATSRMNDRPDMSPRPFDVDRDGLVIGEGSGTLVLEAWGSAVSRGVHIYGEIIGYGTNCDGAHLTSPSVAGMSGALALALEDAQIKARDVDYINAHATATRAGDVCESQATLAVMGGDIPISSTKAYMGHTLGACGALETMICLGSFQDGFLPASRNLRTPDPECAELHYLFEPKIINSAEVIMNNNFAFGGLNTSLILRKV